MSHLSYKSNISFNSHLIRNLSTINDCFCWAMSKDPLDMSCLNLWNLHTFSTLHLIFFTITMFAMFDIDFFNGVCVLQLLDFLTFRSSIILTYSHFPLGSILVLCLATMTICGWWFLHQYLSYLKVVKQKDQSFPSTSLVSFLLLVL
jgi:hypothetical protein